MTHEKIPRDVKLAILSKPGVISVGRGSVSGRDVALVTVDRESDLGPGDFPETLAGHPVYIDRDSRPTNEQSFDDPETRVRPVKPGLSTSRRPDGGSGSTGWLMTDGQRLYFSSNNHVWGAGEVGDAIVQPSDRDNSEGLSVSDRLIGHFAGRVNPKGPDGVGGGSRATVDMSWATVAQGVEVTNEVNGVGAPVGKRRPEPGDPLVLSGQTSGVSRGECVAQEVAIDMGPYILEDVIKTTDISGGGDSGSPVMHDDGSMHAAGSHFAGSDTAGYACNIDNWEAASGLTVITADHHWPGQNKRPSSEYVTSMSGLDVTFNAGPSRDPEGAIDSYEWDFGDGATDHGRVVTHTYPSGGSYRVKLTVTDDVGASWTNSTTLNINPNKCTYHGTNRSQLVYNGSRQDLFDAWQACELSTEEFVEQTPRGQGLGSVSKRGISANRAGMAFLAGGIFVAWMLGK